MTQIITPIDDTFQLQLEDMSVDFADTSPIVRKDDSDQDQVDVQVLGGGPSATGEISKTRAYLIVLILLFINLLNYMDRFTIAGVLVDIQNYYGLQGSEDGLIQTVFIISYMIFSPIFGYLGDRYTRKYIMGGGILLWSLLTLSGSFIDKNHFWLFILIRGAVGIGEASYSTIAPTIIADLFVKDLRTKMLMCFYFAIPVGSGLGYVVGANVAKALNGWQWALRVTPPLGILCVILIFTVLVEPKRGESEGGTNLHNTDYLSDLKELFRNKSFMLSTVGFTCVAFVTGALALWAPLFMFKTITAQGTKADQGDIAFIFGGITVAAGFLGVAMGAEGSRRYKKRNPRADPLVCAFGLLMCTPFLFFSLVLSEHNIIVAWVIFLGLARLLSVYYIYEYIANHHILEVLSPSNKKCYNFEAIEEVLIFFGEVFLCLNWSIIADMLLYVVIPTRRSTAEAVQILISHALGDAGSPYLIGIMSDAFAKSYKGPADSPGVQSRTLRTAFYLTPFICVLGGAFFLATAMFIEKDKANCAKQTHVKNPGDVSINGGFDNPSALTTDVTITVAGPNRSNIL